MSEFHDPADDFDGIKEDDYPLPQWWVLTFIGSIIFSVFYYFYFHTGADRSIAKEYSDAKAKLEANQMAANSNGSGNGVEKYAAALADPTSLKAGQAIFATNCVACHAAEGEGLIGPNLTDKHWIHGEGSLEDIARVVINGVPEKGMIPWGNQLKEDQIVAVVAFVKSLEGQMKPGKAPEGQKVD